MIGLKITKHNRAGLQTTINLGLQSVTKIFNIGLKSAMRLQSAIRFDLKD